VRAQNPTQQTKQTIAGVQKRLRTVRVEAIPMRRACFAVIRPFMAR
jgi:hypothetical protein